MSSRIYVLSILILVVGIALPIIIGYLDVSKKQIGSITTVVVPEKVHKYVTVTITTTTSISKTAEPGYILLGEEYGNVIKFLENNRKMLTEVQQILSPMLGYSNIFTTVPIAIPASIPASVPLAREKSETVYLATTVSRTNVQVEGVDEADIVKNSDKVIIIASQNRIYIFDVLNKRISSVINITAATSESYTIIRGLYLYGDRLIVITSSPYIIKSALQLRLENSSVKFEFKRNLELSNVYIFDISEIYSPTLLRNISASGSYLDSRLSDGYLYIVATENIYGDDGNYIVPLIDGAPIDPSSITAIDELPTVYTIILAIDLESLEYRATAYMTSYGFRIYMSRSNNLYIATPIASYQELYLYTVLKFIEISLKYLPSDISETVSRYMKKGNYSKAYSYIIDYLSSLDYKEALSIIEKINSELDKIGYSYVDATRFYVYEINGSAISYKGTFTVNGSLLDQFCMEEYRDRYFIVATTSTKQTVKYEISEYRIVAPPMYRDVEIVVCSNSKCTTTTITIEKNVSTTGRIGVFPVFASTSTSNNVYMVDIRNLKIVGVLKDLAEGERIYAARLVKNVFFLVTFRQVDPLFAIDITDPANPMVLGYLKIPGFSEYLHPLSGDVLLGIGVEDDALKISLFNVSNPKDMAEISMIKIGNTWSPVLQDHHAVTIYPTRNKVVIPVYMGYGIKQGFILVNYTDAELGLENIVDHSNPLRSVYIDSKLYLVSGTAIKIYDIDIGRVEEEIKFG
ncbi:MAG: beta-propeller domain-containing protein [Ignisphaera sp.]